MNAVTVIGLFLLHQAGISFVNERGGLQGVAGAFIPEVAVGDFAKLAVDEWNEMIQRHLVAAREGLEQERDGTVFTHYFGVHGFRVQQNAG